jgi:RhtX/FptX family siderophore transporter
MKTHEKLGLLATLYLAQGLPFGFFTQALPVLMRKQGLSLPEIGFTHLLALPWALKFLWAPLIDRFGSTAFGRRRSWILPLQAVSVILVTSLALTDPRTGLGLMMAAALLTNLVAATQDIPTDGLAVDLLSDRERGLGNGVQVAGYRVGMIIGGGFLLIVFDRAGWRLTFTSMAAMLALATLPIALFRERPTIAKTNEEPPGALAWIEVLKRPRMLLWIGLIALYKAGDALASAMVKPLLVDRGMSLEDIGLLVGVVGFCAGLAGALLGGYLASRFGRTKTLLGCGVLQTLAIAGYIAPAAGFGGNTALAVACTLEHLTGGMATVALFTLMMDACRERYGATDYTVQACVVVIATGAAAIASGFVAQNLGYARHFGLGALVSAAGVALAAIAFARGLVPPPRSSDLPI